MPDSASWNSTLSFKSEFHYIYTRGEKKYDTLFLGGRQKKNKMKKEMYRAHYLSHLEFNYLTIENYLMYNNFRSLYSHHRIFAGDNINIKYKKKNLRAHEQQVLSIVSYKNIALT